MDHRQAKLAFSIFIHLFTYHSFIHLFKEDNKILNIVLIKSQRSAGQCWKSLLLNQYEVDPFTFTEMEKKLTLERFQNEVSIR